MFTVLSYPEENYLIFVQGQRLQLGVLIFEHNSRYHFQTDDIADLPRRRAKRHDHEKFICRKKNQNTNFAKKCNCRVITLNHR